VLLGSRGTKAFIHKAGSNRTTNFGDDTVSLIGVYLNDYGFHFVQGETITNNTFDTKNKIHLPDLFMRTYKNSNVNLVIEVDGDIHGCDIENRNERTRKRNKDYHRAGINYLVIHPSELKEYGFPVKGDSKFFDLIVYMVSEKLAQIRDRGE
jgi:hypothetical protein